MDISASLIAKGTLGAAAAASAGAGYAYRDKIGDFISSLRSSPQNIETTTNDNAELNKKIKNLGIDNCELENAGTEKECTLKKADLEKINFSNKEGANVSTDLDESKTVKLKIEKTEDSTDFPEGIKFTFSGFDADITIKKASDQEADKITLKKGTNPEFKMEDGKLKKAWEFGNWGNKLRLTCTNSNGTNTCTVGNGGINVKEGENTVEEATLDGTGDTKIKFAEDEADHNQGFKFFVDSDVTLKKGGADATGVTKLSGSGSSYEIKKEGEKWFLVKKATAN